MRREAESGANNVAYGYGASVALVFTGKEGLGPMSGRYECQLSFYDSGIDECGGI